jgi:hypothetical protein
MTFLAQDLPDPSHQRAINDFILPDVIPVASRIVRVCWTLELLDNFAFSTAFHASYAIQIFPVRFITPVSALTHFFIIFALFSSGEFVSIPGEFQRSHL